MDCALTAGRYSPARSPQPNIRATQYSDDNVTAATGFKRLGIVVAGLLAALFGALATMSFVIPADAVREAVKNEIRAVTGLDPVLRGPIAVSLFPTGSVTFSDVILGEERSHAAALAAEQIVARLSFFPLLTGRIQVADVTLVRPTIVITMENGSLSNWSGLVATLAKTLDPNSARTAAFSEIRIGEGTIVVRDPARQVFETLSDVEMSLAWPSISRSFAATGRFRWRGESVDASASTGDFFAALAGQRAGLKIRLAGKPIKAAFDGHISHLPTLKIEGTLAVDGASLRATVDWTMRKQLAGPGFSRFALKAQANVVGRTIALTGLNVEVDGNAAEGVVTATTDGRHTLQATLAAEALDLTPYVPGIKLLTGSERDWNPIPIRLDELDGVDLDLRLSAARIALPNVTLGRTAIAANLRGGRLPRHRRQGRGCIPTR